LRKLRKAGLVCVLVTNQSGIGRGLFSYSEYESVHAEFLRQIEGELDAAYMCPDPPTKPSPRRKPNTGMLEEAAIELNLDLNRSWLVGDKEADLLCGRNAGLRTLLVRTGYGNRTEKSARFLADFVCDSISEAAEIILQFSKKDNNIEKNLYFPPCRSWVEVDEKAIRHNAKLALELASPAGLLPVLKADAYGHGALRVALALRGLADIFGMACLAEAIELQEAIERTDSGWKPDFLLLSPCLPEERQIAVERNFVVTVSSFKETEFYSKIAEGVSSPCRVHFKIDTGMGRLGAWREEALEQLQMVRCLDWVKVEMISTHLSSADEDEAYTLEQLNWFASVEAHLRREFPNVRLHALNSAGLLRYPKYAFDLVRPGLMLYGITPFNGNKESGGKCVSLRPAMEWRAKVLIVREHPPGRRISYGGEFVTRRKSRIAILAVGYADGFFRQIRSGTAQVLIKGQRCPVIGRVTMDQILVDVTDSGDVQPGDVAVLLGRDGDDEITANEFATWASTIPWHVFTSLGPRVQRVSPFCTKNTLR
ncbi:MAG: alanine racemase, partial [Chthoniobacterales bacterium]|nr:alanine racemase [Chthoniobacterales bacterium]